MSARAPAAEASSAPNLDVNHTRCLAADARWAPAEAEAETRAPWSVEWAEAVARGGVTYDVRGVPGARGYQADKVEL